MRTLSVPNIGDKLTLAQDWEFMLYNWYDNWSFKNLVVADFNDHLPYREQCRPFTIPKGITLTVASAMIRKGRNDENGFTFNIHKAEAEKLLNPYGGVREGQIKLYVKLEDVNKMVFE